MSWLGALVLARPALLVLSWVLVARMLMASVSQPRRQGSRTARVWPWLLGSALVLLSADLALFVILDGARTWSQVLALAPWAAWWSPGWTWSSRWLLT